MNARELVITIKSMFDGRGTDAAGKSLGETAGRAAGAANGFSSVRQTADACNGSIRGLASALGNMAQQIPALAGAAGPISLAIAAFMAWKKAIDAVIASQESLAKGLRDTALGNAAANINSLEASYTRLRDSIAQAAEAAQDYYDAEASKDDAQMRSDLAGLDLEKAQRTATLDPDDPLAARGLDLDIAEKRAVIEDAAATRKADREIAALRAQSAATTAAKEAAGVRMDEAQGSFSGLAGQFNNVKSKAEATDPWWAVTGSLQKQAKEDAIRSAQPELDKIAGAMGAAASAMEKAAADKQQAESESVSLVNSIAVALTNRDTQATSRQTGAVTRGSQSAALGRDTAAASAADESRYRRELSEAGRLQALGNEMVKLDSEADAQRSILAGARRSPRSAGRGLASAWSGGRIVSQSDADAAGNAAQQASAAAAQAAVAALKRIETQQRQLEAQIKNGR